MRYALIERNVAEKAGYSPLTHRIVGSKMILNENELRADGDAEETARNLGGFLMTHSEVTNKIRQNKYE